MTYKTKNATIVFAFLALLMVAPLAGQQANGDGTALVDAVCGFNEANPPSFGSLTRGAAITAEQTATFSPTATSTGTGVISVTADDWDGLGARASGSITLNADIVEDETLTIHQIVYTAKDAPTGNVQFDADGTAIDAARTLAAAINAGDGGATGLIATTGGTAVVTIKSQERGTVGNGATFNLVENSAGTTSVSGATLGVGGGTVGGSGVLPHLPAENTKIKISGVATTTPGGSTGDNYATKPINLPAEGVAATEILSGTSSEEAVEISFEISTAYLTAATGTVLLSGTSAGDTVTINGIKYTAHATTTSGTNFSIAPATDILDAAELVIAINANDGTLLTAANSGSATVTVTADIAGTSGNTFTMLETGSMTISGAKFTGGTEHLQNLPYDGALTQDLTFTIACE